MTILKNATVLCGTDNSLHACDLLFDESGILSFCPQTLPDGVSEIDATGLYALPGFIDTHIHGCVATEFASPDEQFDKGLLWLAQNGVTSVAPTVRALPAPRTSAAIRNIVREAGRQADGAHNGARIRGIHLEGPYVSPKRKGSMQPMGEAPDLTALRTFAADGQGLLKIMTFAPELPGAEAFIREAVRLGVSISLGHTDADYAQARAAADAGATRVTHLFNAMRPFSHRDPGVLGEALTDDRLMCEMICDFVHLSPETMRLALRAKGAEHITAISDAGYMSGLGEGEFIVDGRKRIVKNGVCTNESGTIAGSIQPVSYGLRNLRSMGVSLPDISRMASENPAKALGLTRVGKLLPGWEADVLLIDSSFRIRGVWIGGRRISL